MAGCKPVLWRLETGGFLWLTGSRFQETPCSQGNKKVVINQDTHIFLGVHVQLFIPPHTCGHTTEACTHDTRRQHKSYTHTQKGI